MSEYSDRLRRERREELLKRALPAEVIDEFAAKTEAGESFPSAAYAYVPDPDKPSTWKLRLWKTPTGGPDPGIVGAAVAALGEGFRGNKVQIPSVDLPKVKAKVRAAWKVANSDKDSEEMPEVIRASAHTSLLSTMALSEEEQFELDYLLELGLWDSIKRAVSRVLPGKQKIEKRDEEKKVTKESPKDEPKTEIIEPVREEKRDAEATEDGVGPDGFGKKLKGNPCHDELGRFCTTDDWPKNGGRKIKKVGENIEIERGGEKHIMKEVWEVEAKDGKKLQLLDYDGKSSDKDKKIWLDALAKNHENNPWEPPATMFVADLPEESRESDAFAMVMSNTPDLIVMNNGKAGGISSKTFHQSMLDQSMPVAKNMTAGEYIVTHEYGHVNMFREGESQWDTEYLHENPMINNALSDYGKNNFIEGYAEAYVEWYGSQGTTTNVAAQGYAFFEGWKGEERIKQMDKFIEELLEGPKVVDYFDGETPAKVIGIESKEPSEKAKVRTKKVIAKLQRLQNKK